MGIKYILTEKEGVNEKTAINISIGIVWIFEVVFHFIKPELECKGCTPRLCGGIYLPLVNSFD